jgi:hypothetical protein
MAHAKKVSAAFFVATILFLIAAVLPLAKGRPVKSAFLGVAVVNLVISVALSKSAGGGDKTSPRLARRLASFPISNFQFPIFSPIHYPPTTDHCPSRRPRIPAHRRVTVFLFQTSNFQFLTLRYSPPFPTNLQK